MEELHSSAGKGTGKKVVTLAADVEVPSEDLLGFYKAQVDRFQQEREEYLQRLAAIEVRVLVVGKKAEADDVVVLGFPERVAPTTMGSQSPR